MGNLTLLGQIGGYTPDQLSDLVVPVMIFAIPIVGIMLSHQRKMAKMFMERQSAQPDADIQALRREIADLKALVHQQTIALDGLARPIPMVERIQERVEA